MEEKIKGLKIGQIVYWAYDDRPIDGYGVSKCEITEIHKDHMIIKDEYSNLWIDYEDYFGENESSCKVFNTEKEAWAWLDKRA